LGPLNEPGGGLMLLYTREGGRWLPVDESGYSYKAGAQPKNFLGRPLVLVNNWIQESFISESGFSEAAADAFFAALVQLDRDTGGAVFRSPIHLIGQSRGTIVTSELAQRLGTYRVGPQKPPDVQMTLLDPHDFKQDSLDIHLGDAVSLVKKAADAATLLSGPLGAAAKRIVGLLELTLKVTGNETLH